MQITNTYHEVIQATNNKDIAFFHYPHNYPCHFHKKIEIVYVVKGSCNVKINNQDNIVHQDDIVFIPSYKSHEHIAYDDSRRIIILPIEKFSQDIYAILRNKTFSSFVLDDKDFNKKYLLPIAKLMIRHNQSIDLLKKSLPEVFIGQLIEHYKIVNEDNVNIDKQAEIFDYLTTTHTNDISLESVAKHFNYDKYYFSKLFTKITGQNFSSYVNQMRINTFLKKISAQNITETSIISIALDSGFNSTASFYRIFKKTTGLSPKEFFNK